MIQSYQRFIFLLLKTKFLLSYHLFLLSGYDPESEEFYKKYEENFEKSLAANFKLDINVVPEFSKDVKNFYFKGNSITKQEQDAFIQYRGDIHFVNGILLMLDGQSQKKTPTYLYKYSHNPQLSLVQKLFNLNLKGFVLQNLMQFSKQEKFFRVKNF